MVLQNVTKEKDIIDQSGYERSIECLPRVEDFRHIGQLHFHKYCELIYCEKGRLTVICGNSKIKLSCGDMIYLSANEIHTLEYEDDYSEHYCIKFHPKVMSVADNNFDAETAGNIIINCLNKYEYFTGKELDSCPHSIKDMFISAIEEYSRSDYSAYMLVQAYTQQIMAFVIGRRTVGNLFDFNSPFVKKVSDYIEKNYPTATLKQAAEVSNISYNYFSALFHKTFGVSFKKYLNLIKINKSIIMLKDRSRSITDIAYELGFSSSSHYVNTFKKLKDTTPNEFRKNI